MIIYQFINGCSTNEVKIYFHICDHSIIKFGGKFYLGFLNTSNVDSLDRFRKTLVDKVKPDISISKKQNHSKEEKTRIKYANEFIENMGLGDPKHVVIKSFLIKMTVETKIL